MIAIVFLLTIRLLLHCKYSVMHFLNSKAVTVSHPATTRTWALTCNMQLNLQQAP